MELVGSTGLASTAASVGGISSASASLDDCLFRYENFFVASRPPERRSWMVFS